MHVSSVFMHICIKYVRYKIDTIIVIHNIITCIDVIIILLSLLINPTFCFKKKNYYQNI